LVTAIAEEKSQSCSTPMRIAVLGATGGVGAHVVRLALEQGHAVVALARDPSKIVASGDLMKKVAFDVSLATAAELQASIEGTDFVLSCLGNRRGEEKIVEQGTSMLLKAMAASGVPRMAMVSSIGVGDSGLQLLRLGFGGWVFAALFSTLLRGTKNDLAATEELCIGSAEGWVSSARPHARPSEVSCVVVRPAGLSNAPGEGKYDVALASGTVGGSVAREDVARFMLTLVADAQYDNGAVSVGGSAPRTGH